MRKSINSNRIAGNAFTSTDRVQLDVDQIKDFVDIVREKTNGKTEYFIGGFDVSTFVATFDFVFKKTKDTKSVYVKEPMRNKIILEGFFRQSLSRQMQRIVDEAGNEILSKMDKDNNIKVLSKSKKVKK